MATVFPFERSFEQVEANINECADAVIASLESSFMSMPKGKGFVEYAAFEAAYEILRRTTKGFSSLSSSRARKAVEDDAMALIVI